jgi:hypothetical protein
LPIVIHALTIHLFSPAFFSFIAGFNSLEENDITAVIDSPSRYHKLFSKGKRKVQFGMGGNSPKQKCPSHISA